MTVVLTVLFLPGVAGWALGEEVLSNKDRADLARKWLSAVSHDDIYGSIGIARKLVKDVSVGPIGEDDINVAARAGISSSFFTAPFNFWDFQLWRSAYFFHELSKEIVKDSANGIEAIFQAVSDRVSPYEKESKELPWPLAVWQRGFGACDRQAWVFCETAYQLGWETQVVYLVDEVTGTSPHTVAEIRKDEEVYFVDVYKKVLLKESISEVASDSELLQEIWAVEKYRKAVKKCLFWTPSYPQDYRPCNQKLFVTLDGTLRDRCPRFAVPPHERLATYKELGQETIFDEPPFPMLLWHYPFRLLRADIERYCRHYGMDFPK